MSYQSQALATSGLLGLWMMNDAVGATTAVDSGPNNLPLTYSAAKVDGVEDILGGGNGMLSSASLYASRAVTAGSTLAPTAAITIGAWMNATAWVGAGGTFLAGRQNHFRVANNANGSPGQLAWIPTSGDLRMAQSWLTLNKAYFVVGTYDGLIQQLYVNGVLMQETTRAGTLASVADAFVVGATSTAFSGTISGVAVWNRALTAGEIYELWSAGTKVTPVTPPIKLDNIYDAKLGSAMVAAPAARCTICHGSRRTGEPTVTRGSLTYHPGCYGARAEMRSQATPTSATTWANYEGPLLRLIHFVMSVQTERVTDITKPIYFDGTRMQPTGSTITKDFDTYGPWAMTGALVARHMGLPKEHWMIPLVISQVERVWQLQSATGNIAETSGGAGGNDFVIGHLAEAILCMGPYVSTATLSRWIRNLVALGKYMISYPTLAGSESRWYTNGNREAWELWCYWMLYLVTGDTAWEDQYETQLTFMQTPGTPAGGWVADTSGNRTYGWVEVVTPTQPDGSDGKGYLIERSSSRVSSIVGVDGPAVLDGYDPNYVDFTNAALSRLWSYNQDARILKLLNMQYNLVIDRTNLTSATVGDVTAWNTDGRNGSRQNNFSSWNSPSVPALIRASQARVTQTILAGTFGETVRFWSKDMAPSTNLSRGLNTTCGTWLRLLPNAPVLA